MAYNHSGRYRLAWAFEFLEDGDRCSFGEGESFVYDSLHHCFVSEKDGAIISERVAAKMGRTKRKALFVEASERSVALV